MKRISVWIIEGEVMVVNQREGLPKCFMAEAISFSVRFSWRW